jgi:hypothetical protein
VLRGGNVGQEVGEPSVQPEAIAEPEIRRRDARQRLLAAIRIGIGPRVEPGVDRHPRRRR